MDKGFAIGCVTIIVGVVLCVVTLAVVMNHPGLARFPPVPMMLSAVALAPIVVAMVLRNRGRVLTARGVYAALLGAIGVGVLLAAACFGLLVGVRP
jgi:hypothetical protein